MRQRNLLVVLLFVLPLTTLYLFLRSRPRATLATGSIPTHHKHHVVAAIKKSRLEWVWKEVHGWIPAVYRAADPNTPLHTKLNKGREANQYLTYVLEHYERLPEFMVFTHDHRWSNHVDKAFASNAESINMLDLEHVRRVGYQSLSCDVPDSCNIPLNSPYNFANRRMEGTEFEEGWHAIFLSPLPDMIYGPQYAQFAVTKDQVLLRPKSDYQRMHDWLMTTEQSDALSGRTFEHAWHHVFGKPEFFCTPREECLCDAWGFCDKHDPEVQSAINGTRWLGEDGNPRGYAEWKAQRERQGLESNLVIYWVESMWDDPEQLDAVKAIPELYNATSFP